MATYTWIRLAAVSMVSGLVAATAAGCSAEDGGGNEEVSAVGQTLGLEAGAPDGGNNNPCVLRKLDQSKTGQAPGDNPEACWANADKKPWAPATPSFTCPAVCPLAVLQTEPERRHCDHGGGFPNTTCEIDRTIYYGCVSSIQVLPPPPDAGTATAPGTPKPTPNSAPNSGPGYTYDPNGGALVCANGSVRDADGYWSCSL